MQLHEQLRRAWLQAADGVDGWVAATSRTRLHAQADFARLLRGEPPIARIDGPATAHQLVAETSLARLLRYPAAGGGAGRPVLIVASLINRFYVLDLLPEISAIDLMVRAGHEVWVLDWKAPGAAGPDLTFADYVDETIPWAARTAIAAGEATQVTMVGYCMGGTMATMAAARHPELFAGLILLGTPIDFQQSGELASLTTRDRFDADLLIDVTGNMPPALMQSGFKLMKPLDAISKVVRMHKETDERALRHMVALESWLEDNVAFPGGVYREYIGRLYQDNALVRGEMTVGGTPVDLRRITMPLLVVIALRDHICAPPSSRALLPLAASVDKRTLEFDTGHIGMTASRRSLDKLWPQITGWMADRAG